jgi:crotonobetainyl-CoA:carnitine CoA-transferase CaiB-like acyl-CoA transferase
LNGFKVLETGPRLASAVSGRLFAELGADVIKVEPPGGTPDRRRGPAVNAGDVGGIFLSQNLSKRGIELDLNHPSDKACFESLARDADLVVSSWHPAEMQAQGIGSGELEKMAPSSVIAYLTPFGMSGPRSLYRGSDLVVFHSSGLAKSLIGPVHDPESTPPVRAAGEQSEFVSGVATACAAMLGLFRKETGGGAAVIDVSMQEALSFMEVMGLAAPAFGNPGRPRRMKRRPGPNLTILPASDGFIAISPREQHQWKQWLGVLGDPEWGNEPRFATRALREENSEAIYELLAEWSSKYKKMDLFRIAQENHVPCFPLMNPAEHIESEQLKSRSFFRQVQTGENRSCLLPGIPYKTCDEDVTTVKPYLLHAPGSSPPLSWLVQAVNSSLPSGTVAQGNGELPLKGVRVADLSWVIAGPTCTRFFASMGAEIVKVETSSRPDPGRVGQLHDVLGQGKLGITLNLKTREGSEAIKKLISGCDIVVENFAPGVMDRLGLGWDVLKKLRPDLVMVSASGTGQTGPTRHVAAYGTLLQVYTGFAGQNGYKGQAPAIGMAWADPLCGMLLAFSATAALNKSRKTGEGRRIDFSMVEAMLSTMPGPLLEYQLTGKQSEPPGNDDELFSPHGVYHCNEEDTWVAVAVTDQSEWASLASVIGAPEGAGLWDLDTRRLRSVEIDSLIEVWTRSKSASSAMDELQKNGVPAAASVATASLLDDAHLNERGFFKTLTDREGVERKMPTLPWQWSGGEEPQYGRPPGLGSDTAKVLRELLGYSEYEIASMEASGALQ